MACPKVNDRRVSPLADRVLQPRAAARIADRPWGIVEGWARSADHAQLAQRMEAVGQDLMVGNRVGCDSVGCDWLGRNWVGHS